MLTVKVDFENLQQKLKDVVASQEYAFLVQTLTSAKKVYIIGNGGLHNVASHAATDMTRLIPKKSFTSFDSIGFITSNANDFGYDNVFQRWLETYVQNVEKTDNVLIIGMTCSGNSNNIISALEWAHENAFETCLITGVRSTTYQYHQTREITFDCQYFHTVEVLALMLFYDLIYQLGQACPSIKSENIRKGFTGN